ncbi:NAD(P)-dependent oxidoreductase [Snodgrassella sp. CFCC 13594]|uniref:NAD-dependent epimerase/dehydratase family protein n=1 Tax=Snodgrassella sp. CFCC 13594 TaxID=1775559 RepID=UPI002100F795
MLLEMDKAHVSRMVFFSTDMTYGVPNTCPVATDHPQKPLGPYGEGKVEAERLIRGYSQLNATIFRPRLITGAGRLGILEKLFKLIALNLPVPMIGNGLNRYQMVSVEDCVQAALRAGEKNFPRSAYNLGSSSPPTTKELLKAIIKHANSKSFVIPIPTQLIKPVLTGLDKLGLTLLYPEQFGIADKNILLDTQDTVGELGWAPTKSDIEAMCEAFDNFLQLQKQ